MNPYYRQWDISDLNSWLGKDEFEDNDTNLDIEECDTNSCLDECDENNNQFDGELDE